MRTSDPARNDGPPVSPPPLHPLRRAFRKALRTALKRSRRKAAKLAAEKEAGAGAAEIRECGELIKANLGALKRGLETVTLPDLFHPGEQRVIILNPRLKPLDNARKYFKKYRKLIDGAERVAAELERCREEGRALAEVVDNYAAWETEAAPDQLPPPELVAAAAARRVHIPGLERPRSSRADQREVLVGLREFTSKDGMKILVGKTARDNDRLSLRLARGNEWWFHVAHVKGSHVLVKGVYAGGGEVAVITRKNAKQARNASLPQETLLDAAHLAVYFSKARRAAKAEVHYTQAKHLAKSKQAPPGQVTLRQHKTLTLRLEPERLERLLQRQSGD